MPETTKRPPPEIGDRVDYLSPIAGAMVETRQVVGRLRYPEPPGPGTLIGPNGWGETCVVLGTYEGVTLIARATRPDVDRAEMATAFTRGPRSLFEGAAMRRGIKLPEWLRR